MESLKVVLPGSTLVMQAVNTNQEKALKQQAKQVLSLLSVGQLGRFEDDLRGFQMLYLVLSKKFVWVKHPKVLSS